MAKKKEFTLPQILIGVALVFLIGTIVPSLLDASSDISVLVGVLIVVCVLYFLVKYGKGVLSLIGIDLDSGDGD